MADTIPQPLCQANPVGPFRRVYCYLASAPVIGRVGHHAKFLNARSTGRALGPERFKPRMVLDWNRVEGNWKQMKGKVKEKWGNLTDDDLTAINGQRDQLEGKIQERYGLAKDQVRKDIDDWYDAQTW